MVEVEVMDYEARVASPDLLKVRDLIRQPQQPWFSEGENTLLNRSVSRDEFTGIGTVYLIVARLDGEPVGTAWYQTGDERGEVGACAFVFTHPSYRGLGVANAVMSRLVSHFGERGGRVVYLGTSEPRAREVYQRVGFRVYNGVVMRHMGKEAEDRSFDEEFFSNVGDARMRDATWGDLARLTALYSCPHPWFIKDYGEKLYSHPTLPQKRALSVPISLFLRAEEGSNRLIVMENPRGRLVGAMSIYRSDALRGGLSLDFLVVPSYLQQMRVLLEEGSRIARGLGGGPIRAIVSDLDGGKEEVLSALGFQPAERVTPEVLPTGTAIGMRSFQVTS
ncbi:MAG: GNAT family N-acetyltransferase [Thaumarchaeota archaeon]|nr:GNAT family N-acetyltransferase [Nitrososphaerota archaeon]